MTTTAHPGVNEEGPADLADLSPDAVASAIRLVTRAETMGLLRRLEDEQIDLGHVDAAVQALGAQGIGRGITATWRGDDAASALARLGEALESSPHPTTEWAAMDELLGHALLSRLTHVGETSIRRYAIGERRTPDATARRLHFVALVCADLLGAYNDVGVRGWFVRRRSALGGESPVDVLKEGWEPDDVPVQVVADLARSLTTMGAT